MPSGNTRFGLEWEVKEVQVINNVVDGGPCVLEDKVLGLQEL